MSGMAPRRLVRWLAGASLLLAFAAASGGRALGGCVHDVPAIAHFENLVQAGAMPEAQAPGDPALPDPSRPCTGPTCSKAPAVPLAPSSASTFAVEPWACLAAVLLIPAPNPSFLAPDPGRALPVRGGSSVFHPPRSSR